jgi:protein-tyrosine phosphatase
MSSHLRPITKENPYKLCFVCLGNICRSPTAEGIFIHKVRERGLSSYFYIDSAGTAAYHTGEPANSKSQAVANERGVHLPSIARRFERFDLEEFDLILAMDSENYSNLKALDSSSLFTSKIRLMREFDPEVSSAEFLDNTLQNLDVPDPYYGGLKGFHDVYDLLERSCEALLEELSGWIEKEAQV